MVRLIRDPRLKVAGTDALLVSLSTPHWSLPDRKLTWGVHLYAPGGTAVRSFDRKFEVREVLVALAEATRNTPGFKGRLEAYLRTTDAADLDKATAASLARRMAHANPAVRQHAFRDAMRLGAPAYRALRSLIASTPDVETRRQLSAVVNRFEPLARVVKKRHLQKTNGLPSGKVPKGARLVISRECGSLWSIHDGKKHPVTSLAALAHVRKRARVVAGRTIAHLPEGSLYR